jgi:hypothetical protein
MISGREAYEKALNKERFKRYASEPAA